MATIVFMKRRLLALALPLVLIPAPAHATVVVVSREAFDRVQLQDCKHKVHQLFRTHGQSSFRGTVYLNRDYAASSVYNGPYISITYRFYSGCWRVADKYWNEETPHE